MSNDEMHGWQVKFRSATELPRGLRADVERQARRRLFLSIFFTAVVLGETAVGVAVLATDDSAHGRAMGGFLIGASLAIAIVLVRILGPSWTAAALTPDEVLSLMAKRLEAGRRLGRVAPWLSTAVAAGVSVLIVTAPAPAATRIFGVAFSVFVALGGWAMPRLIRRRMAARAALLERWRADLSGASEP